MLRFIQNIISPTTPTNILQSAPRAKTPQTTPHILVKNPTPKPISTPKEETPKLRVAKLIMVTANNNNKFYEMQENANATFTVSYGRVGAKGTSYTYPIKEWDKRLRQKVTKGYTDQTHLFASTSTPDVTEVKFADIEDASVQKLLQNLTLYAKTSVRKNYYVEAKDVTERQVESAQATLDRLVALVDKKMAIHTFNNILLELYKIIPRRMANVKEHLIETQPKTSDDLQSIEKMLANEQATLDVMRGQVIQENPTNSNTETQHLQTLVESLGLHIELVQDRKIAQGIRKMMGEHSDKFQRAFKVTNLRTQKDFDALLESKSNKKTELFWHGSRNENWLAILKEGLVLRPANAVINGKMFGYGLYFADKFRKSLNYTSLRGSYWTNGGSNQGFLALYDVHVGKQLKITNHQSWCYDLSEKNLKKQNKNCDSLFAKGGVDLKNNEYIIYNQAQCTVRYIVEVA